MAHVRHNARFGKSICAGAVIGLCVSTLVGCRSNSETDVIPAAPTEGAIHDTRANTAVARASNPASASESERHDRVESPDSNVETSARMPSLATDEIHQQTRERRPSESAESSPQPQLSAEAVSLFNRLNSPGLSFEDWDQTQQQLVAMGAEAVPVLAARLRSSSELDRESAATTLALMGTSAEGAIAELMDALNDESDFVRANSAAALVQFPGHEEDVAWVLVSLLETSQPHLREMAALNLSALGSEAAPHVKQLTSTLAADNPPEIKLPVVQLLGRIGPPAKGAIPQLKQIAFEEQGPIRDEAAAALNLISLASQTNDAEPRQ